MILKVAGCARARGAVVVLASAVAVVIPSAANGATSLPDGRAWEQASPPNKHGAPLEPITEQGGLIQAAGGGGAFAYVALGPVIGDPQGVRSPHDSQMVAERSSDGWRTQDISTRHEEISIIKPGFASEYKLFSENLDSAIVEPEGVTRLAPEDPENTERTPYKRELTGACAVPPPYERSCFEPLVTTGNVPPGTEFGGNEIEPGSGQWGNGVVFQTATPDLAHAALSSPEILAPGFEQGFVPAGKPNLYELSEGLLQLVSVLPDGRPAAEAGLSSQLGGNSMRGAVARNGGMFFFEATDAGTAHLFARDTEVAQTAQADEPEPGAEGGVGRAVFQAASSDGGKVLFTDEAKLTKDSTAVPNQKSDLYMCEVELDAEGHLSCVLSDLSVDPHAGEAANLPRESTVSAIDAAGEHVYFAANGVLTDQSNEHGEHALAGDCNDEKGGAEPTCNLYAVNTATHEISLVAVLSSRDKPDWSRLVELTARSSPDGHYLAFMSQRPLTGYDNRDALSGQPDEEVYLYDSSTGALRCASCDPSGQRPHGVLDKGGFPGLLVDHPKTWEGQWLAGSVPGWTPQSEGFATYQSRYLSNSGRLFFNSPSPLVPKDANGVEDVYEYEPPGLGSCTSSDETYSPTSGGCVALISSGTSAEESAFLDASESGDEVFFLSAARLLRSDVDSAFDVYDARVCSAASPCIKESEAPASCEGDSCQGPIQAPSALTPASLTYTGPGNLTAPAPASPAKAKPPSRAQLLAKALRSCRKGKASSPKAKKRRRSCEAKARKRYGAKRASRAARASHRGARR